MENNFKFFLPVAIEKGKVNAKGQQEMRIKGIASTGDTDEQGEELDSSGFDVTYFKNNGVFNLNHAKAGLESALGEPTSAILTKRGLEVEGVLYNDNPIAVQTYELAKILEKNSPNRRMGLSIEGTVTERDKVNPKKIKKAKITGCAITLNPINPNAFMEVMKGLDNGLNWKYELTEEGDKKYLLHVLDQQNGQNVTVDTDYNISITKALEAGSMTGRETTNSTEASGAALKAEDLEHSENQVIQKKKKKNEKYLSKSEAYEQIFQDLHTIDLKSIARIYQLAQKISPMSQNKVTLEALSKAYEALGIANPADTVNEDEFQSTVAICKSMIAEDPSLTKDAFIEIMEEDSISKDLAAKAFDECQPTPTTTIAKGMKADDGDSDDDDIAADEANLAVKKAKKAGKKKKEIEGILKGMNCKPAILEKAMESIEDDEEGEVDKKEVKELKKSLANIEALLQNQQVTQAKSLETIFKGFTHQLEENATLIEGLQQKVLDLENTPAGRKSIITKGFVSKNEERSIAEQRQEGAQMLQMSNSVHKSFAVNLISKSIDWENLDAKTRRLAEDCTYLEATGIALPAAAEFLKSHKIEVIS